MSLALTDFTETKGGGYFTRPLIPADDHFAGTVEVLRADGLNLGGVAPLEVEALIKADRDKPQPKLPGGGIKALIERPVTLFDEHNPDSSTRVADKGKTVTISSADALDLAKIAVQNDADQPAGGGDAPNEPNAEQTPAKPVPVAPKP